MDRHVVKVHMPEILIAIQDGENSDHRKPSPTVDDQMAQTPMVLGPLEAEKMTSEPDVQPTVSVAIQVGGSESSHSGVAVDGFADDVQIVDSVVLGEEFDAPNFNEDLVEDLLNDLQNMPLVDLGDDLDSDLFGEYQFL